MDANEHEGILAVFLAEAEDIVKGLFAQLEELQYGYDGQRILDDIHRGFHTLYGGAAVLELAELSECARLSERVMDRLRTRRIALSPSLVSLIVGAAGAMEVMLSRLIDHQPVSPIPEELRARLLKAAGRPLERKGAEVIRPRQADSLLGVFFDNAASVSRAAQRGGEPGVLAQGAAAAAVEEGRPVTRTSEPSINDLVSELAWVRNRLMGFRQEGESDKLNKALAYLDLVTQDMERWLQRSGPRNER